MDILVALALVVGHEEVDVVSHAGDVEVLDGAGLLGILQDVPGGLQHIGMGPGVADNGTYIRLDDGYCDFLFRHVDTLKKGMIGTS